MVKKICMKTDVSAYSADEKQRIARRAQRKLGSEVGLILLGGFSFLMVVLFVFGDKTFLPVAELIGARPTVVWVAMSAVISAIWAVWHHRRAKPKIAQARDLHAEISHLYQNKLRDERNAK